MIFNFLLSCLLCLSYYFYSLQAYDPVNLMKDFPAPFTEHNKILGLILFYNLYQIDPMMIILNEYVSMCEGGWDPTVVFFTTVKYSAQLKKYLALKHYCSRLDRPINITISYHDPSIGIALGAEHRKYIHPVLDQYDFFIYHESDIMLKFTHVTTYLKETKKLHEILPVDGLRDHVIGFQRYRRIPRGNSLGINFGEQDIFEQELLEETPDFIPVCVESIPYLHVKGNTHQAIWMFTRQQIYQLSEKCNFLNQSSPSREFMSSFSIYEHRPHYCSMNKLIPAEHFMTFNIQHYWPQKHVSWVSTWGVQETALQGKNSNALSCWKEVVARNTEMLENFTKENI